ncbi:MAG: HK97 gp10 family phage protein [Prevotellaceae bacterium]|nr:HK97 gp10 family phage protein [Candidatus Faecinaster equi]
MGIQVQGENSIFDKLNKLSDTSKIEGAMNNAVLRIERDAKINAPVDTGALRNSIASTVETGSGVIEGIVYTPLEYAPYVEYGTWKMKAQPFMGPALNQNRELIIDTLKEALAND